MNKKGESIENSKHLSGSFHSFFQSIIREFRLGNFLSNLTFNQSPGSFFTIDSALSILLDNCKKIPTTLSFASSKFSPAVGTIFR
ncbi:hypothetical protein RCL_jg5381.t1 [Rhizophagus clarus]|uniref:Uncharacterized protein n=1 Tax=Rhizophagus clarus TaxID=94130 RepID=A0A8H3LLR3_9GLOM|nr:hypothetical protein RCL_jg5381.t1 [Rhizophagus clarus]